MKKVRLQGCAGKAMTHLGLRPYQLRLKGFPGPLSPGPHCQSYLGAYSGQAYLGQSCSAEQMVITFFSFFCFFSFFSFSFSLLPLLHSLLFCLALHLLVLLLFLVFFCFYPQVPQHLNPSIFTCTPESTHFFPCLSLTVVAFTVSDSNPIPRKKKIDFGTDSLPPPADCDN